MGIRQRKAEGLHGEPMTIPDRLPILDRGDHAPDDGRACAMEAASWIAGEPWSSHPRSVHPIIARVARTANDQLDDEQRQRLWPLVLSSVGTARPFRPILYRRLRASMRLQVRTGGRDDLPGLWRNLLDEHARLTGHRPATIPGERLVSLDDHLRNLSGREPHRAG